MLEVYNKRDLVDAITLMNKNNISNIDNILSKEISILLFENEIKANNPFIYLSNFNKDVFSLEKLLENKIYFEIFNNKISKNKICSYEKLFDISILKDMI